MKPIHWIIEDHLCADCGGRILKSVANAGMTPGGNPIWKCADCKKQTTNMFASSICWCGFAMRDNYHLKGSYICLPFSILEEKPHLKEAFSEAGCDPDRREVGIMLRSSFDRLEKINKKRNT